jgi:hypothetical protein
MLTPKEAKHIKSMNDPENKYIPKVLSRCQDVFCINSSLR